MACKIHVGDIGTIFEVEIVDCDATVISVQSATVKQIIFRKPDGTTVVKSAVFTTDGADGLIQYTIVADDLDMSGTNWHIQGFVVLPSGEWYSNYGQFTVWDNL